MSPFELSKTFHETFPAKPTWTAKDIPDLTGKVFIVTGGNTGIGYVTVKELLAHGGKVYLAAGSRAKAQDGIEELKKETGVSDPQLLFLELDLADLTKVKASAQEFLRREQRLDVLINNAGVMIPPLSDLTAQAYDLQFGVNVVALHLFSTLLFPILTSTAASAGAGYKARIVNISSSAHLASPVGAIDYDTVKLDTATGKNTKRESLGRSGLYSQSKSATIMLSMALSRSLASAGIIIISLNPGNIKTDLRRHVPGLARGLMQSMLFDTWYGAISSLHAATAPQALEYNGKYLVPWAKVGEPRKDHLDEKKQEELKDWLDAEIAAYL